MFIPLCTYTPHLWLTLKMDCWHLCLMINRYLALAEFETLGLTGMYWLLRWLWMALLSWKTRRPTQPSTRHNSFWDAWNTMIATKVCWQIEGLKNAWYVEKQHGFRSFSNDFSPEYFFGEIKWNSTSEQIEEGRQPKIQHLSMSTIQNHSVPWTTHQLVQDFNRRFLQPPHGPWPSIRSIGRRHDVGALCRAWWLWYHEGIAFGVAGSTISVHPMSCGVQAEVDQERHIPCVFFSLYKWPQLKNWMPNSKMDHVI